MNQHSVNSKLDDDEVVSFFHPVQGDNKPEIVKVSYLRQAISQVFANRPIEQAINDTLRSQKITPPVDYTVEQESRIVNVHQRWFQDGLECEILTLGGKRWQKGKLRLKTTIELEFCPELHSDELGVPSDANLAHESLDDIRRTITNPSEIQQQ